MGKKKQVSKNRQKQTHRQREKQKQQLLRANLEQNFIKNIKAHFTTAENRPAFIPFIEQLVALRDDPVLNPPPVPQLEIAIEEPDERAPLLAKEKKKKALPALTATKALIADENRDNVAIKEEVFKEICELLSHPQVLTHLSTKNIQQAQPPESWSNYFKRKGTRFFTHALLAAAIPISGWLFYNLSGSTSETVEQESLVVESLAFINFVYAQTIQANAFFLAAIIVEEVENLILKTRQFSRTHSTFETIGYFAVNLVKIGIAGVANYYVFSLGFQQLIDPDRPDLEKLLGLISANIQTFSTANFLVNYFPTLILSFIKNRNFSMAGLYKANDDGLAEAAPQPDEHFDWADINQQLADLQDPDKASNSDAGYNPNLGLLLFSKQWQHDDQEKTL